MDIVLTGCASGIGQHMANVLSGQGHRLLVTDIDESALKAHAARMGWAPPRVQVRRLDVTDPEDWSRAITLAVGAWGRIDVLMNIAGFIEPGFIHETSAQAIARQMDINALGSMYGSRAAAAQMVAQGHGHIINVASLAGVAPVQGLSAYCASKFALRGFSLAIAQELRPKGVFVSVVCPGAVETPMLEKQVPLDAAAVTFSGPTLTVLDIERAIMKRALGKRELEIALPEVRGWLARLANLLPEVAIALGPSFVRRGRASQIKRRA